MLKINLLEKASNLNKNKLKVLNQILSLPLGYQSNKHLQIKLVYRERKMFLKFYQVHLFLIKIQTHRVQKILSTKHKPQETRF